MWQSTNNLIQLNVQSTTSTLIIELMKINLFFKEFSLTLDLYINALWESYKESFFFVECIYVCIQFFLHDESY